MVAILTIVLGVIFVLLVLSLLATTIMELLAALLKLRGKNLKKALGNLLGEYYEKNPESEDTLLNKFLNNPMFKQLSYQYSHKSTNPPSYVNPSSFRMILMDIIMNDAKVSDLCKIEEIEAKIEALDNEEIRAVLRQLLRESDGKVEVFRAKIEEWFNAVMDRASGWYKRKTQLILIWLGLAIAVLFNADTISIFDRLQKDPDTAEKIAQMAEDYVATHENDSTLVKTNMEYEEALDEVKKIKDTQLNYMRSRLGMGWDEVNTATFTNYDWIVKILGWIITALAISKGAPFWFDILKKIVSVRSSGSKP